MKSFAVILAAAGLVAAVPQAGLSQCGLNCVNSMIAIAQSQFGCASGDVVCYCTQPRFGYGLRDCSNEACGSDAPAIQAYGQQYCASIAASASVSAGAITTGALGVLSSALGTATAVPTMTGTGGALASSAASAVSAASNSAASAVSSASGAVASALSSASGALASAHSSASGALASGASAVSSRAASATGAAASAASSAAGAAPMVTGLPVAAGALGFAAWLLI